MKFHRLFIGLFPVFSILLTLLAFNINNYGQCGVYLKRGYTNIFPYRAYINRVEDMNGDNIPDLVGSGIDTTGN